MSSLPELDFEIIFTNNRSTDGSLASINKLQSTHPNVHVITYSRNFGYQASVLGGLTYATGDAVVVIDVDCEDPPELIPKFVEKWRLGHDIVYGIRGKRQEARWITWCRLIFYRVLKATADTDIILDMAEFSLLSRRVRDSIIKNSNTFPFLRAEIAYSGFRKIGIPYNRQQRVIGNSKYNLWGMVLFAVAGILSISTFPLRIPVYLAPVLFLINFIGLALEFCYGVETFKALIVTNLFFLISLVITQGLYIARIYKNGIGRPVFIVDWDDSDSRLNTIK